MERTARSRPVGSRLIMSLLLLLLIAPIVHPPLVAQTATHGVGVGHAAPNFSRVDLTHRKIVLSSYRGKISSSTSGRRGANRVSRRCPRSWNGRTSMAPEIFR